MAYFTKNFQNSLEVFLMGFGGDLLIMIKIVHSFTMSLATFRSEAPIGRLDVCKIPFPRQRQGCRLDQSAANAGFYLTPRFLGRIYSCSLLLLGSSGG
jgi:hypothetical protein